MEPGFWKEGVYKRRVEEIIAASLAIPDATVYVDLAGNDTTGDGSLWNPYLTVQKGFTEARTILAGGARDVLVQLSAGEFSIGATTLDLDTTGLHIAGMGQDVTRITSTSTPCISLDAAGSTRSSISSLWAQGNGSGGVGYGIQIVPAAGAEIRLYRCTGNVTNNVGGDGFQYNDATGANLIAEHVRGICAGNGNGFDIAVGNANAIVEIIDLYGESTTGTTGNTVVIYVGARGQINDVHGVHLGNGKGLAATFYASNIHVSNIRGENLGGGSWYGVDLIVGVGTLVDGVYAKSGGSTLGAAPIKLANVGDRGVVRNIVLNATAGSYLADLRSTSAPNYRMMIDGMSAIGVGGGSSPAISIPQSAAGSVFVFRNVDLRHPGMLIEIGALGSQPDPSVEIEGGHWETTHATLPAFKCADADWTGYFQIGEGAFVKTGGGPWAEFTDSNSLQGRFIDRGADVHEACADANIDETKVVRQTRGPAATKADTDLTSSQIY